MSMIRFGKHLAYALALGTVLAACGSDSPPPPTNVGNTDVPIAATTGTPGVISFANSSIAATSETNEPLNIGESEVTLATSETEEPDASI